MELVLVVGPQLSASSTPTKLLMGAFLHDAAKVDELSYERDIAYTDAGQLLGHMSLGVIDARRDGPQASSRKDGQPFPERLLMELKHHDHQPPRRVRIR